jgi:prolyl 4-hydroxylase
MKSDGSTRWAYIPQRWRLFGTDRHPVERIDDILLKTASQLLLIFEGGQFIYPGVDLNFERKINVMDSKAEDGKKIKSYILKTLSMRPLLFQVDNLLDDDECHYLIDQAAPRLIQSKVKIDVDNNSVRGQEVVVGENIGGGTSGDVKTRSSRGLFMSSREHTTLKRIDERISNLTGLNIMNIEDVQILKYEVGDYYLPHNDYLSPQLYQSHSMVKLTHAGHKNRLVTVFWYMNSNVSGGCTSFPHAPHHNSFATQAVGGEAPYTSDYDVSASEVKIKMNSNNNNETVKQVQDMIDCDYGLRIHPRKGRAIIFYTLLPNGDGDMYSEHAACAVKKGTKWAANKWIWNQARVQSQ